MHLAVRHTVTARGGCPRLFYSRGVLGLIPASIHLQATMPRICSPKRLNCLLGAKPPSRFGVRGVDLRDSEHEVGGEFEHEGWGD